MSRKGRAIAGLEILATALLLVLAGLIGIGPIVWFLVICAILGIALLIVLKIAGRLA